MPWLLHGALGPGLLRHRLGGLHPRWTGRGHLACPGGFGEATAASGRWAALGRRGAGRGEHTGLHLCGVLAGWTGRMVFLVVFFLMMNMNMFVFCCLLLCFVVFCCCCYQYCYISIVIIIVILIIVHNNNDTAVSGIMGWWGWWDPQCIFLASRMSLITARHAQTCRNSKN